jgi:hypothetical protein
MNLRQNHYLAALAVATMLLGLGCGQNKEREKPQAFIVERGKVVEVVTKGDFKGLMAAAPITINRVTIGPGINVASECTSDNPAQELYTNTKDPTANDQIEFKSSSPQAYVITFPNDATPLTQQDGATAVGTAASPIIVPANNANPNFAGPYVVKFALQPNTDPQCKLSGNTCVFPYNINFGMGGAQCNIATSPNKGSNDIIVKCGPGC